MSAANPSDEVKEPLVNGRALLTAVQSIRSTFGEDGFLKVLSAVDPAVRQLFDGAILASDWYPLHVMFPMFGQSRASVKSTPGFVIRLTSTGM